MAQALFTTTVSAPVSAPISNRRKAVLARKAAQREKDALRVGMFMRQVQIHTPKFIEREDGRKVRVWDDAEQTGPQDIVNWLRGLRFVEDLDDGLEFVLPSTIKRLVRDGHLVKAKVGGGYFVAAKCAKQYGLDQFMFRGNKWLA